MVLTAQKETLLSLGNCDLFEKIGYRCMGALYKGRHRLTGETVAVKVMPPFEVGKDLAFQRFARECRILSALNDPHIVRAIDFGIDGRNPYLVMEFVEGESLEQRLARQGSMPEAEAVRVIADVADGLGHAHGQGLVHRNVKPEKILIANDGTVKLTDLGMVRQIEAPQGLTRAGTILGTPNFMAPEQLCNASKATPQCDIYSLAATLYMTATGKVPFGECNLAEMWAKKMRNDLPSPRTLVPALSARIDSAIRRAMSPRAEDRPASCAEFVNDLTRAGEIESGMGSEETAGALLISEPVSVQVLPSVAEPSESLAASIVSEPATIDRHKHDGHFGWLTQLIFALVLAAGFLVGLLTFAR